MAGVRGDHYEDLASEIRIHYAGGRSDTPATLVCTHPIPQTPRARRIQVEAPHGPRATLRTHVAIGAEIARSLSGITRDHNGAAGRRKVAATSKADDDCQRPPPSCNTGHGFQSADSESAGSEIRG